MDLLAARSLPYMTRRNYVIEMQHLLLWGMLAGLVEGTVSAVIVSKTFDAGNLLITVVQATPAFANLVSLVWGALLVGRPKLRVLTLLAAGCILATASVGMTPPTPAAGWLFAAQIALSRAFMSGVVTSRASLWNRNYPASHRGRITARLQLVRALTGLPVIIGTGLLFDFQPLSYRWLYPLVAALGAAGILWMQRSHVRGERRMLALAQNSADRAMDDADRIEPFTLGSLMSPRMLLSRMAETLLADPRFARYCTAQMCIGCANLMAMPVNTIVLTKVLKLSYTASNLQTDILPRIAMLLMLPLWANLFDRVGVLRFRVLNSLCWSGSMLFCGAGALLAHQVGDAPGIFPVAVGIYAVGRIIDGLAQGGGAIAWNIGHLHFARDERADLYMGVHVSLTGLRGLVAPFAGALLYHYIDWLVFVVAFASATTGMVLFRRLARDERRATRRSA